MKTIDYHNFLEKVYNSQSNAILINALEPSPIRRVQIPNSLNIYQVDDIEQELSKEAEIIVYCTDIPCNLSSNLYYMLKQLGYQNVTRYAGGLREWDSKDQALEEIWTSSAA